MLQLTIYLGEGTLIGAGDLTAAVVGVDDPVSEDSLPLEGPLPPGGCCCCCCGPAPCCCPAPWLVSEDSSGMGDWSFVKSITIGRRGAAELASMRERRKI
jgi:hypothetical protein